MRIKTGDTTQKISFIAVDSTDGFTREVSISSWTVYYSLNGGTATAMTTPTVAELSTANMPGVYTLLIDESGMTSAKGELTLHISATGVAPVTRVIEITDNFEADNYARLGAPAGASIAADLLVIDNFVDGLESTIGTAGAGLTALGDTRIANLDATVSSRSTYAGGAVASVTGAVGSVTAAVTVGTNNDKTGYALSAAGVQALWDALTTALTTVGSIGKKLADWAMGTDNKVLLSDNAQTGVTIPTVTTLTNAPSDSSGVTTLLTRVPSEVAQRSHLTNGTGNITPPTNIGIWDRVDATISSRLATAGYTAPDNTSITAIKAKTDNLPSGVKKNTLLNNFEFLMVDSTDNKTGKTGLTITATRSIDGGAFAACANSAVEVSSGIYKINLAAADLNGDVVTFMFAGTAANNRVITVKTSV